MNKKFREELKELINEVLDERESRSNYNKIYYDQFTNNPQLLVVKGLLTQEEFDNVYDSLQKEHGCCESVED